MHVASTSAKKTKKRRPCWRIRYSSGNWTLFAFARFATSAQSLITWVKHVQKSPCRISVEIRTICWDFLVDLIIKLTMLKFLFGNDYRLDLHLLPWVRLSIGNLWIYLDIWWWMNESSCQLLSRHICPGHKQKNPRLQKHNEIERVYVLSSAKDVHRRQRGDYDMMIRYDIPNWPLPIVAFVGQWNKQLK